MKLRKSAKDLRSIRTMRDVWNGRAPAKSGVRLSRGTSVRVRFARLMPHRTRVEDKRLIHPWVFQGRPESAGGKLIARVVQMVEPEAHVRIGASSEVVVLYRLTDVLKETLRVDLHGDILTLCAKGRDRHTGRPFHISSEAHVPGVTAGWRLSVAYSTPILEVHIAPPAQKTPGTGGCR